MTIDLTDPSTAPSLDLALEVFPADVRRTLVQQASWRRQIARSNPSLEFIATGLGSWTPGSTVTVGFYGGDAELHRQIAEATTQLTDACNVELCFGLNSATGRYRSWSERDDSYSADIRVSFDQPGFWSHVGMDSIDPTIGAPGGLVGGRPHQRSMNLGGFDLHLPVRWERTVRHEFMHALAFHHAHMNTGSVCRGEFRWDDDDGYVRTRDDGSFIADTEGRRPGIYTYMSGAPNNWTREMIDRNLRTIEPASMAASPFDSASIMLYRFPELFYQTSPSPCAPIGYGVDLSDADKRGLARLYPYDLSQIDALIERAVTARHALAALAPVPDLSYLEASSALPATDDEWALGATVVLDRFLKGHQPCQ